MDQNQRKNIWLLGMTSGMILFLLMVYILVKQPELLHKIDVSGQLLYQLVSSHDGLTSFFTYITTLGNRHAFILYCILLAGSIIFVQRKKLVWFILMAFVFSVLCNHFVKDIFARTRPELEHLVYASGFSFPSGHAMNSMVFFGLLLYFFYGIAQKKMAKSTDCNRFFNCHFRHCYESSSSWCSFCFRYCCWFKFGTVYCLCDLICL